MNKIPIIYYNNRVDIYQTLKDAIQFLFLMPGSTIMEPELAKLLGTSRTPVREALIRLSSESLVDIFPQCGTYVSRIDFSLAREVAYMRHILEQQNCIELCRNKTPLKTAVEQYLVLMKLCVRNNDAYEYLRNDNEFHRALFAVNGHERIWQFISNSRAHYNRIVLLDLMLPGHLEKSYEEHCKIVDCIENGNEEELLKILWEHHDQSGMDYDLIQKTFPQYFNN